MTMSEFDARAATWDDDAAKTERAQAVAHAIIGSVPLTGAMHAMEYGCGTGLLTFMLRPRLGQIVLADVSDGMLAVAAGKIAATNDVAMRTVRLDLLVDPLPIERFDIIYSLMTLHHIADTDAILRRFHAALATNGSYALPTSMPRMAPSTAWDLMAIPALIARFLARRRGRPVSRPLHFRRPMRSGRRSMAGSAAIRSSSWWRGNHEVGRVNSVGPHPGHGWRVL